MTKINIKAERFMMNLLHKDIILVENLARQNGVTMSWIYRAVLFALVKKFKNHLPQDLEIQRPLKFDEDFRQITVCFYGDKKKWMTLSRIWQVELGPLIRFGWNLYLKGELELDLESVETVKNTKIHQNGILEIQKNQTNNKRCVCLYQNEAEIYLRENYRPKNPERNILLMQMGINNRKNIY